jgi:N-formylglutamate amidohydrolase
MEGASGFHGFEPFEVRRPARQSVPFVFNSPHSGRLYPEAFLKQVRLDAQAIRRSEDYYVDVLFASVVGLGAPILLAHFPRSFLDVNREPYELDPRMFEGKLPPYANISSMRVAGGLGTVPRLVAENMEIYSGRIPVEDAIARVETIYRPYHACLRRLIGETHGVFGHAVLIDCHSMPASVRMTGSIARPDFIIGDRYGMSASQDLSQAAAMLLKEMGFSVTRNKPYAGGFITEHYGRPARGLHAIQIEINRGLYVDERTMGKTANFHRLCGVIESFCAGLIRIAGEVAAERPLAAE